MIILDEIRKEKPLAQAVEELERAQAGMSGSFVNAFERARDNYEIVASNVELDRRGEVAWHVEQLMQRFEGIFEEIRAINVEHNVELVQPVTTTRNDLALGNSDETANADEVLA